MDVSLTPLGISFVIVKAFLFFINYIWLYPLFFRRKKYWIWIISAVVLLLAGICLRYLLEEIAYPAWLGFRNYKYGTSLSYYVRDNFVWLSAWVVLSTIIRFIQDKTSAERDNTKLEAQRIEAELALLKSQLNPHFLFNTLNSIYSLSYQQSDKAPDAILKLSEVMRYMLYDSEDRLVPLEKELQYLRSFIELQQARFKENIYVDVLVEGLVGDQQIVPVLLIAFVENAFKHGVLSDAEDPVLIQVTIEGNQLLLIVQNKISHQQKDSTGGIGMPNIRRRLELLYPGKHRLNIRETNSHYICELNLEL